ncbi:MAG TPA: hypothetical protein VFE58_03750 [Tepidisphaeraceae bacterium]|jgi:hypothetical protein|nr:hypothetical protein [Tepidisphaeraceae bacterium]
MHRHRTIAIATLLICTLLNGASALAQNTSALINEALDRPYRLAVKDVTIQAFIDKIKNDTGVPIRVDQSTYDLLPWGQQTTFTANIENENLRQSLDIITRSLGLTCVLQDESLELRPLAALKRLGKRATRTELQALDILYSTPLGPVAAPNVQQLLTLIDQKLTDAKAPFAIENRAGDSLKPDQVISVARNATLADALDAITLTTPATWYPWGKSIVILNKADQIRNLLQSKTVSLRYNGVELSQVLMELSQHAGVDFDLQPGSIQSVPQEFRTVRLLFDNVTVKQALDSLAGFTGLTWTANDKGVYIWNAGATTGTTGPVAARDPAIGIIQLDNGMQLILPQSQVPSDIREYLHSRTERELAKIRQMMKEEGFKPTTQPAPTTTPADERL